MKNNLKTNLLTLLIVAFFVSVPLLSYAQADGDLGNAGEGDLTEVTKIENPISADSLYELIKIILEGIVKIGVPIIALAIIYSGFLFVSARGKPEAIKKAKDALIYTIIGAAILLGSWALAQLISDTVLQL